MTETIHIVASSWIHEIRHNYCRREIELITKDGSRWIYWGIPHSVADSLFHADSIGRAYNKTIRGRYGSAKWIANIKGVNP